MDQKNNCNELAAEFSDVSLGDERLNARVRKIAAVLSSARDRSLPEAHGRDASQLEGTYRFLSNPSVTAEEILSAHLRKTTQRAMEAGAVLMVHDSTTFAFGGRSRRGLGTLGSSDCLGFYAHISLCISEDGEPLGGARLYAWRREKKPHRGKRPQQESQYDPNRESLRWNEAVHDTGDVFRGVASVVHVMDREGDCLELISDMIEHDHRFVVRLSHDRRMDADRLRRDVPKLFATLSSAPVVLEREVRLVSKPGKEPVQALQRKKLVWGKTRAAALVIRAQSLTISPGNGAHAHIPDSLTLNFVDVSEPDAPEGVEPVKWRLVTTDPIDTPDAVARVVDIYRRRWLIEEYFKAIKTGCGYEQLQLENGESLIRALVLYMTVAWRMLRMRWYDRNRPDQPAEKVLTLVQVEALKAVCKRKGKPLPEQLTVHEALTAIAAMGGHLRQNGPPGWLTLARGFEKLLYIEIGWCAREPTNTDNLLNLAVK